MSKDTFQRFAQFAYTGDYSISKTEKRGTRSKSDQVEIKAASVAPSTINGVRGRIGSPEPDDIVEANGRHIPVADTVDNDALPEKIDDDSGSILNYPNTLSKKKGKKKRRKTGTEEPLPAVTPAQEPELESADLLPNHVPTDEETIAPSEPQIQTEPAPVSKESKPAEQTSHILVADFHSISYPLLASRDRYEGTCEPSTDFNKDHSYSNVLLSHASLYILGDSQLIDSLKALALFKLHKTLCAFELNDENIGDITSLARYAYPIGDKAVDEGIGGLRELICQYMAIHAVELSSDPRFMNLLAGGGQFVKDFFKFELQRIHN